MSDARYLSPDPGVRAIALALYASVRAAPLICPHGHVDPRVFADPDYQFGGPADLFITPDHYLLRMLYAQGEALERYGVARRDGGAVATDQREIWRRFAARFDLFRGTPSGLWLRDALRDLFEVTAPLSAATADASFDQVAARLATPAMRPRALYERFNIAVLCTTDAATDTLAAHTAIRASGWRGDIRPTFRPDALFALDRPGWGDQLDALRAVTRSDIGDYAGFRAALVARRAFFRQLGATATDHGVTTPTTLALTPAEAETLFQRARRGEAGADDAARFTAHMLIEMAAMSVEDGLVMQLHAGALRDHNGPLHAVFGPDVGADIPVRTEFTRNLRPLLERFGNDPRLTLILFTLDETTYSRELAPLAGHYPALRLGPPWWFFDSPNGMARYFDRVMETAGLANTAGFNDDTRAFCSIPARHDLWRRVGADWLAGLVAREIVTFDEAGAMLGDLATNLARRAYRLDTPVTGAA